MRDAVECALNEIVPTAMEEMESVLEKKLCDLKDSLSPAPVEPAPVPPHQDFTKGIYVGLGVGVCLFIGLVTGLLLAQVL